MEAFTFTLKLFLWVTKYPILFIYYSKTLNSEEFKANAACNDRLSTVQQEIVHRCFLQRRFGLVTRPLNLQGFLQGAETDCLKGAHTGDKYDI